MWSSLLPWNASADFFSHYDIGEQVVSFAGKSIWSLYKAKRKGGGSVGTSEAVSIFRFDIKDHHQTNDTPLVERAKQSLKRIKTLRHPSILKYVDSCETDKSICIVTEEISPLAEYLEHASSSFSPSQREFSIAYGLLNVAKGLQFFNTDCQLNHNNINIHSIFVNTSGVWKIGGLEFVCPLDESPPLRMDELTDKYTPPERLDPTKVRHPGHKFAPDSWGMGCLVWESFNKPLTPSSSVKTVGKMSKPLSVHYNKLVQSSPRNRCSPMDFVKSCKEAEVFFHKSPLQTIVFLEEIQLEKDASEKSKFFTRLDSDLESFPLDICKNKILPDLINAFEYGGAGAAILDPVFKIGKMLNENEYQMKLVPCIIKLYACKDRATRCKLLQQLDSYIHYLTSNVINEQIFPQVIQGFLDSNFTIREQTVKSMLHLAPKLNSANLNEELMKHFSRLLTRDEEGGIRANTTVCLGKIAKHLSIPTQHNILLPTLLRVLRDPFPPARHAAIAGMAANESIFYLRECTTKIMPALCQMCIDPDANVRKLTFKSLKLFIEIAESESEKESSSSSVKNGLVPMVQSTSSSTAHSDSSSSHHPIKEDMKSLSIKD